MSAVVQHTKNYRPDIDGLRALAVLAVVGYHFFPAKIPSGFIGVDIFFVISGFLISGIIWDDLAENKFSFLKFYARRLRRLFPALLLVLAFTAMLGWLFLFPHEYKALGKHIAGGAGFISNILYWQESGYFDAEAAAKPLLHLWSLGIEEQFYIFFPFLIFLLWKKTSRVVFFMGILLAFSLAYNFHLANKDAAADFYSPFARFWELLMGTVLAGVNRGGPDSLPHRAAAKMNESLLRLFKNPVRTGAPLSCLMSATGFVLLACSLFFFKNLPAWPSLWALFPSLGAVLILAAGPNIFNRRLLANRLAVSIGLISYPWYLWHWPVFTYLRIIFCGGAMPERSTTVAVFFLTLFLAWLTYKFVEAPFRFGIQFKKLKTVSLGLLMLAAFCAGFFIYSNQGIPGRGLEAPDFETTANKDKACPLYTKITPSKAEVAADTSFTFCRFSGEQGRPTVALLGDSHAQSAYRGIEKINRTLGLNTVLLGRTGPRGGPPLSGVGWDRIENDKELQRLNQEFIRRTFEVLSRSDIEAVFIFLLAEHAHARLTSNIQPSVDRLSEAGKQVFIVVDWPHLPRAAVAYARSGGKFHRQELTRGKLAENLHYQAYLQFLHSLKNVTVIDGTWDAFCPDTECRVFSEAGQLLYLDKNHLTKIGSEFLAEKVLAPYLTEIAARARQQQ